MHRKQVNERSPLRVLEKSIHGGLGQGKLGVVVARHGVGKTAFLVSVAIDDLMRGQKVLHVALDESLDRVLSFYDEVFQDLTHAESLEDVWKVRLDLERHRRIHCYKRQAFDSAKLTEALQFLREHGAFQPSAIIIDGFDFSTAGPDEVAALRRVAAEFSAELWMAAVTTRDAGRDDRGIPEPLSALVDTIDVILKMAHDGNAVHVRLLKDHDNPDVSDLPLALDPRTLLLVRE